MSLDFSDWLGIVGLLLTLAIAFWRYLPPTRDRARLVVASILHRKKRFRVAYAVLIKIPHNDKFLVVPAPLDRPAEYGPPGGVVKYYPSAEATLNSFEFEPETAPAALSADRRRDLRGFVPGRALVPFTAWMASGDDRESDEAAALRELEEELTSSGVSISSETIGKVRLRLIRQVVEGPRAIKTARGDFRQVRIFKVYLALEDSDEGARAIKTVIDSVRRGGTAVTARLIDSSCIYDGRCTDGRIGGHAEYLLRKRRHRHDPPPLP